MYPPSSFQSPKMPRNILALNLACAACLACSPKSSEPLLAVKDAPTSRPTSSVQISSDAKTIYLDDLLSIVYGMTHPAETYGPGCLDFKWSDYLKERNKKVSTRPLPITIAEIVRYYEKTCTEKKGSCTKSDQDAWECTLFVQDGDRFTIRLKFKLTPSIQLVENSMHCSYAG